jgi:hypothetical protein
LPANFKSALKLVPEKKTIFISLNKPPSFSIKSDAKWVKVVHSPEAVLINPIEVPDFTNNNASKFKVHVVEVDTICFEKHTNRLIDCEPKLKELLKREHSFDLEATFEGTYQRCSLDSKHTQH